MAWQEVLNFSNDSMNARSRNAFAIEYGYQDTINGAPNPETKAQFRARMLKNHIKEVTKAVETRQALAAVAPVVVED